MAQSNGASPVEKLARFKQRAKEQASRLDVMTIVRASDPSMKVNTPPTRRQLLERHRQKAREATQNACGHFDFFSHLGVEAEVDRSLSCPPGSILPTVATSSFQNSNPNHEPANVSFRSVGYSSPPKEPYALQAKTIYLGHLNAVGTRRRTNKKKQSHGAYAAQGRRRPKHQWKLSKTTTSNLADQTTFYQGILELHEKAVERARREHSNGRNTSNTVLYERAKLRSQKERKRKQVERWCADADAAITAVVAREKRRVEKIR